MNPVVQPLRIVHVGDLHFWAIPKWSDRLLCKRLLGAANLLLRRARKFDRTRGGELAARLVQVRPDWALFSGDFTTTSLETEFAAAKRIFRPLVQELGGRVRAVPGNHDRYTPREFRTRVFERYLEALMPEDNRAYGVDLGRGNYLVGLDCSAANGLGSWGQVTGEMLDTVERLLNVHGKGVKRLWVLAHFPAEDPPGLVKGGRRGQLRGAEDMLDLLGQVPVPIVWLHGHHHRRWAYQSPRVERLLYLNAGAPLMKFGGRIADLGFLEISADEGELEVALQKVSGSGWVREALSLPEGAGQVVVWQ